MGGCASVPKEFLHRPESSPIEEAPAKVEQQPQPDTVAEDITDGGDQKVDNEAPLVELSEPKKEAEVAVDEPTTTEETKVEEPAEPAKEAKTKSDQDKDAPLVIV